MRTVQLERGGRGARRTGGVRTTVRGVDRADLDDGDVPTLGRCAQRTGGP